MEGEKQDLHRSNHPSDEKKNYIDEENMISLEQRKKLDQIITTKVISCEERKRKE